MKKFFNILLAIAAVSVLAVSCEDDEIVLPGEPDESGCYGVYFPNQTASGYHVYDPTQDPVVEFTVVRTNSSGAITVPVEVTASEDGIFEVGTLSFADGQSETTLAVRFDNSAIGTTYELSLGITDGQYASKYNTGATYLDFSMLRVSYVDFLDPTTGEPAIITFYEGWWAEVHTATLKYYELDGIRYCIATCNEGNGIWGDSVDVPFEFNWYTENQNPDGYDYLEVPTQYFGFDYYDWASREESEAVYPIYFMDYYYYWTDMGGYDFGSFLSFANAYNDSYPISYYDGNGGFYFNLRYYIPGVGGWTPDTYDVEAIASGYTRVDYSLSLASDYCEDGVVPVYVETGVDVATVKYAVYEGSLTDTQLANKISAITDGTDASEEITDLTYDEEAGVKYTMLGVTLEESGSYTLVAVVYDEAGNAQGGDSVSFEYVTAEDAQTDEYAVDVHADTEDVSARYEPDGYSNVNAISFYIYGSGLTDVHVLCTKTEYYQEYAETYESYVKDSYYALDEDELAEVNASGGFTNMYVNLTANTSYTILIWATNGKLEKLLTLERTTDGLPLEKVGTGTFTYDAFWIGTDTNDLYRDPNYENTYLLDNWGGGVELRFTYNPETGYVNVPYGQAIGYTYGSYGDVYTGEITDVVSESFLEYYPDANVKSSYSDGTFTFALAYYVSAGILTYGVETFVLDTESTTSVKVAENTSMSLYKLDMSRLAGQNRISCERDPQPVAVEAASQSIRRKTDRSSMIPEKADFNL